MRSKHKISDVKKWFNLLTTQLPMVFYVLDKDGIFTLSEGLGLIKLGLEPGQVVGLSVFDVYKDYPEIIDAVSRALKGENIVFEHNVGDYYIENRLVPQYDENNQVTGIICAALDISDRIKMEQSLQEEKNLSKGIMDSIPGILYLYDEEEHLVYWNKNHEKLTGYSSEELSEMTFADWFKDDVESQLVLIEELKKMLQGEITSTELHLRIKSGAKIPMQVTMVRVIINDKPYMTGIGIDISMLKNTQQKLIDINKNLEDKVLDRTKDLWVANNELADSYNKLRTMQSYLIQSEKMSALGNLVAGIAHEINTPIGVGVTAASYLNEITKEFKNLAKEENINREELLSYIDDLDQASKIILKNLERAGKLVKSFKQVSADQASEPKREFNIKEYLEEIITSLSPKLKKTKQTITVNCNEKLIIDGYPGAFAQIISNLIINSLNHAYEPKESGNIIINVSKIMDMVEIIFSDDGKGIPNSDISKIFDPFFTTNRGIGGTGLGLSVVYNIVTQQFGGKIHCDSHVGKGTTFVISLQLGGI